MTRVVYSKAHGEYVIELELEADEARNIAMLLPFGDAAAKELEDAAVECDAMNLVNDGGDDDE